MKVLLGHPSTISYPKDFYLKIMIPIGNSSKTLCPKDKIQ